LPSTTMLYRLLCIVIGETNPIVVDINDDQLVAHLKDAIKKKKEHVLGAFDANDLTLYQVNIDASNEQNYIQEVKRESENLSKLRKLNPVFELRDYFDSSGPLHRVIHILVEPPGGESIDPSLW
jgi:Crinkler effector protein N-terminal domain